MVVRRVRRSTFTEGAIMERAKYNRALASAHGRQWRKTGETCNTVQRRAAAGAYRTLGGRCTRHDHRTCCRGSLRERVATSAHVAKTRRNVPRRIARGARPRSDVPRTNVLCLRMAEFRLLNCSAETLRLAAGRATPSLPNLGAHPRPR